MKKLKHIELTHQEWLDALRCPTPVRNKKKYRRKKKHKNKNYNFGYNELLKYITIHLKDDSKIKKILDKKYLDLNDMKILNNKCSGIVNLELSGNAKIKDNKICFNISKKNTFLDLKTKIPNAIADISRDIVWHLHPWNISLDYKKNVPNFFSYEDLRIAVNFPTKKFIIFNMRCNNPVIPCVYLVKAKKGIKKNIAKSVIADIYDDIYEKLISGNYDIDFENIKTRLDSVGVYFNYLYRYEEKSFIKFLK